MSYVIENEKLYHIECEGDIELLNNYVEEKELVSKYNFDLYVLLYRGLLGVPLDATVDEEGEIIHTEYGDMPIDNEEFVAGVREARAEWERTKVQLLRIDTWALEHGCRCKELKNVAWL